MTKKINPRQVKTGLIYGPIQPPQMKFMSKEEKIKFIDTICPLLSSESKDLFMGMNIIKTESKNLIEFCHIQKKKDKKQ